MRWAQTVEERDAVVRTIVEHWGSSSPEQPWSVFAGGGRQLRRGLARYQRLSMGPGVAASVSGDGWRGGCAGRASERAVPDLGPASRARRAHRRAPLALRRRSHSARAVRGGSRRWLGWGRDDGAAVDEIEQFLTGTRRAMVSDRVLATVLFTDIVGSTERAAELGDGAWRSLLERHDALVRDEVKRLSRARREVARRRRPRGVRRAEPRDQQRDRDPRGRPGLGIQVRAGLHTGECELLDNGDIGGLAVHIGARISDLAGPGEVLVSSTVRDLIVGSGVALVDRGEQRLKGVPDAWRIFAVET